MRRVAILSAVLFAACAHAGDALTDPVDPAAGGTDRVRMLGEIKGYNQGDPQVEVTVAGRTVHVAVTTYGGGCHSKGETEVRIDGLEAEVVPYDYTAPPGTPCTMPLLSFRHTAALQFHRGGSATIRIRGIDASTRHAGNMQGTEITVVRTVTLP